jgi:hypothetical protein
MTDKQQKDIAATTIIEIRTLVNRLIRDKGSLRGEEQIRKLKEIRDLIDEKTAVREFPSKWMENFRCGGLVSFTTVLGCGLYGDRHALFSDGKRVFMNRERGKHAEIEMLEWLTSKRLPANARELRVIISRSPCEQCLDKIIEFKKAHSFIKIRIGFNHWYHDNSSECSNARKMAESTKFGIQYSVLSQNDLQLFSALYKPHTVSSCDWQTSIDHAYRYCHEQEVELNEKLHYGCAQCMFKRRKCKICKFMLT